MPLLLGVLYVGLLAVILLIVIGPLVALALVLMLRRAKGPAEPKAPTDKT